MGRGVSRRSISAHVASFLLWIVDRINSLMGEQSLGFILMQAQTICAR